MSHFYAFGEFVLEVDERRLLLKGEEIDLSPKVFDTLVLLVQNSGHVVTKDEFMKRLWPDTFVGDDTLAQNISLLRRVLAERTERQDYVATVPKCGYRFVAPIIEKKQPQGVETVEEIPPGNFRGARITGLGQLSASTLEPAVARQQASDFWHGIRSVRFRLAVAIAISLIVGVAAGSITFLTLTRSHPMHFSVPLPVGVRDLALSHDGRILALVAPLPEIGATALWVIEVGGAGSRALPSTEGAAYPFWSPDDKSIAFFADGKLKKIPASGGAVQVICDAPIGRGGSWSPAGVIVFAPLDGEEISRVSEAGGSVELVNGFEQKLATTKSNRWPVFLPDGKHFLYTSIDFGSDLRGEGNAIYLAALDSPEHKRLVTSNSNAAYLLSGYLLFARNGTLMAQRFDTKRLQIMGEAFAVANDTEYLSSVAKALFTVSENGTLVYQSGSGATASELAWFNRNGTQISTLGTPARYANPRLSRDGRKVAVDIDDPQSSNTDVWVIETAGPASRSRLTFDPGQDEAPLWSQDGKRILWLSDRGGKNAFYEKASDGTSNQEFRTPSDGKEFTFASAPNDWSSDGRFLLYTDLQEGDVLHLWLLPMSGERKPFRFLQAHYADVQGQFSPDCHWVAYSSNESGKWQVYVAPFPGPGGTYQISTAGGQEPRWRRDGRELFFLSLDRKLMAVPVRTGSKFQFQSPVPLFGTRAHEPITAEEFFTYDVSADGQRFLINTNVEQHESRPVDIILNWEPKAGK